MAPGAAWTSFETPGERHGEASSHGGENFFMHNVCSRGRHGRDFDCAGTGRRNN